MKLTFVFALSFLAAVLSLDAQILWQEDFTYLDGTIIGANNNTDNPAPDWTATCLGCLSGDWMEVRSNQMEGLDTNGPGEILTEVIDISSSPTGVDISMDISQSGTMEDCTNGSCGCNCVDWVRIEYSLNGGAFTDFSGTAGGFCPNACAGATYVALGNFAPFTFSECLAGNTLQLRISVQSWAGSESHQIDNIIIQNAATPCVLPVELSAFVAVPNGTAVDISWRIEKDDTRFSYLVERSRDGHTFLPLSEISGKGTGDYNYRDAHPAEGFSYYRLRMTDENGFETYSDIEKVDLSDHESVELSVFPNPAVREVTFSAASSIGCVELFDLSGKSVLKHPGTTASDLTLDVGQLTPGIYLYQARIDGLAQQGKLVVK